MSAQPGYFFANTFTVPNTIKGHNFLKPSILVQIAEELGVDIRELFINTKDIESNDPTTVLKRIKSLIDRALSDQ